jgi:hypothetical protein
MTLTSLVSRAVAEHYHRVWKLIWGERRGSPESGRGRATADELLGRACLVRSIDQITDGAGAQLAGSPALTCRPQCRNHCVPGVRSRGGVTGACAPTCRLGTQPPVLEEPYTAEATARAPTAATDCPKSRDFARGCAVGQAIDRSHRIGQTEPVTAWHIIAARTIDSKIAELVDSKAGLAARALDGSDEQVWSSADVQHEALVALLTDTLLAGVSGGPAAGRAERRRANLGTCRRCCLRPKCPARICQ